MTNDLPAMRYVGVPACPIDAADEVKAYCNFVLPRTGEDGAVRSFIEMPLKERGSWEKTINIPPSPRNIYSINYILLVLLLRHKKAKQWGQVR